jgi:hypothetical protein
MRHHIYATREIIRSFIPETVSIFEPITACGHSARPDYIACFGLNAMPGYICLLVPVRVQLNSTLLH